MFVRLYKKKIFFDFVLNFNIISGKIIDFTVDQFLGEIPNYQISQERTREYLLSNEDTKKRYLLLYKNMKEVIDKEKDEGNTNET